MAGAEVRRVWKQIVNPAQTYNCLWQDRIQPSFVELLNEHRYQFIGLHTNSMTPSWLKQPQNSLSMDHSWSCNPQVKNCSQGLGDQFAVDHSKRYLAVSLGAGETGEGHEAAGPREREGSWRGHPNAVVEKGRAGEWALQSQAVSTSWCQGGERLLLAASAHHQGTCGLAGLTKRSCSPLQVEVNLGNSNCSS